ncbi:hypothetical protein VE04_02585 [Pseudogymnoascus sp. 24MN13]|nr:hypothetical protein VE04_02585 [Pseudogymnoascus sp. 24MN13]
MAYPTPINEPFGTTAIAATLPTDGLSNSSGLRALPASGNNRRHSANPLSAPSLQNQRVAAIIQGTGHQISSPAFTNRYNPFPQQQQFYALSAPSSSAALQSQIRTRPQVPLFSQSTGNIHSNNKQSFPPNNMAQDMNLFDDFDSFDLKSSDNMNFPDLDYKYWRALRTMDSPAPAMNRTDSASTCTGTVSSQELVVREDHVLRAQLHRLHEPDVALSIQRVARLPPRPRRRRPMYNSDDLTNGDPWFPLFHDAARLPAPRRGVSARKRNQPLPPIVVEDPNDTVAIKRARNTLAARKSRQKKMERFDELEAEIAKIAAERDMWKAKALARGAN